MFPINFTELQLAKSELSHDDPKLGGNPCNLFIRTSFIMFCIVQFVTLYVICVHYIYILPLFITGHTGRVEWRDDIRNVWLISPTIEQCEEVVSKLTKEQQTKGSRWRIRLRSSSPESALVIISNLSNCAVMTLDIHSTPLDSMCISTLSAELQTTNKSMINLILRYSSLTGGIKQISDALFTNTTLKLLSLTNVTITDEDTSNLSTMLSNNKTLNKLYLSNCNIADNAVRYICEGLTKNQTLTWLNISYNPQITSASTTTIAELINTTNSLTDLQLDNTSLNNDDIKTICTSLVENTTIQKLYLSEPHVDFCEKLDSYQVIKDRLNFQPVLK